MILTSQMGVCEMANGDDHDIQTLGNVFTIIFIISFLKDENHEKIMENQGKIPLVLGKTWHHYFC